MPSTFNSEVETCAVNSRSPNVYGSKKFSGIMNSRNAHGNHSSLAHAQPARYSTKPKMSTTSDPATRRALAAFTPIQYSVTAVRITTKPLLAVLTGSVRSFFRHFHTNNPTAITGTTYPCAYSEPRPQYTHNQANNDSGCTPDAHVLLTKYA